MSERNSTEWNSVEKTYYQKNRDVILNRAKYYYESDKERLKCNSVEKTYYKKTGV